MPRGAPSLEHLAGKPAETPAARDRGANWKMVFARQGPLGGDGWRDLGVEDVLAVLRPEALAQFGRHGPEGSTIVSRMPSSRLARAEPHADFFHRGDRADEPLDRQVLRRHRHDERVGGDERVDADQRQIRRAVEDDDVVALPQPLQQGLERQLASAARRRARGRRWRARRDPVMRSRWGTVVLRIA